MGGHFSATIGGAQYQAKCIVNQLVKSDEYEIFYLTRLVDPSYRPEGYKIIRIAEARGFRKHSFLFDSRSLKHSLDEIRPDIIYQRGLKAYTGIAARYADNHNVRFIFHIAHDYDVMPYRLRALSWRGLLELIEKRIAVYGLRNAGAVIAQTQHQSDLLFENYNRRSTIVLPNFHPKPEEIICKSRSPMQVVWVANFKPMKQPEVFVRLVEDLADRPDVQFVMIGRPGDPRLYGALHERMSRLDNLQYLGEQPIGEVNRVLAQADLFVNTSKAEGFANTFIQAWMRKVPVVTLSVDADGILSERNIGLCGGDYDGMKCAVERLLENDAERAAMAEQAQAYAFKTHSVENIERLIALMTA